MDIVNTFFSFFLDISHISILQSLSNNQLLLQSKILNMSFFGFLDNGLHALFFFLPAILNFFNFLDTNSTVQIILFGEFFLFLVLHIFFDFYFQAGFFIFQQFFGQIVQIIVLELLNFLIVNGNNPISFDFNYFLNYFSLFVQFNFAHLQRLLQFLLLQAVFFLLLFTFQSFVFKTLFVEFVLFFFNLTQFFL